MSYQQKYLKYKKKYEDLKKQIGGDMYDGVNEYEVYMIFPSNKVTEEYFSNMYNKFYISEETKYYDSFFGDTNLQYIVNTENAKLRKKDRKGQMLSFAVITVEFNNNGKPIVDNNIRLFGEKSIGYNPHKCDDENDNYTTISNKTIMLRDILDKKYYNDGKLMEKTAHLILMNTNEGELAPNYEIATYLNKKLNYCMENDEILDVFTFYDNLPKEYESIKAQYKNKQSETESDSETDSEEIKTPTIVTGTATAPAPDMSTMPKKNTTMTSDNTELFDKINKTGSVTVPTIVSASNSISVPAPTQKKELTEEEKELKANMELFNKWYEYGIGKLCEVHKKCSTKNISDKNVTKRLEMIKKQFETIKMKCEKQTEQFKEIYDNMVDLEKSIQ